jgi:hypothetical protein
VGVDSTVLPFLMGHQSEVLKVVLWWWVMVLTVHEQERYLEVPLAEMFAQPQVLEEAAGLEAHVTALLQDRFVEA